MDDTPTKIAASKVPLPQRAKGKAIQVHVDPNLYAAAQAAAKQGGCAVREVIEWGLKEYLAHSAPNEARKLNIPVR